MLFEVRPIHLSLREVTIQSNLRRIIHFTLPMTRRVDTRHQYKKPEQRRRVKVFAGIENNRLSGDVPSGTGRLCEWREDPQQPADRFTSFGAYQVTRIDSTMLQNISKCEVRA